MRLPMIQRFGAAVPDPETMKQQLTKMNALPGFTQPEDVAGACAFLLSLDAKFITGHTLPVDAGALSPLL
jgi:NAD(P)-dependent dehydrogenase (short-subunit alcohol dehydrogenase family)